MPSYFIGYLNAVQTDKTDLGHDDNTVGIQISRLINQNLIQYLEPDFKTYISMMGTGIPVIFLGNNNIYFNYSITQGELTSSDHLPLIIKISTKPIKLKTIKI